MRYKGERERERERIEGFRKVLTSNDYFNFYFVIKKIGWINLKYGYNNLIVCEMVVKRSKIFIKITK